LTLVTLKLNEIHHSMGASIGRFPALLNATSQIVDEEMGVYLIFV
jgi:hypothetical protein